jgi:uncharacterized MAPEG superfamily protein
MNTTGLALTGYILWILLLLCTIGVLRTYLSLKGKHRPNAFKPSGDDVSPFSGRLCRAHANCYEFFPIYGGLLLLALATNATVTEGTALIALAARLGQSITHMLSTSIRAVQIRFFFFLVQVGIALYWTYRFLMIYLT